MTTDSKETQEQLLEELDALRSKMAEVEQSLLASLNARLEGEIAERRRLEKDVLDIDEKVRTQVGQDLHDGLGQILTGVSYLIETLQKALRAKSAPEAVNTAQIHELVSQAIGQIRALAKGLSPLGLQAEGLMQALKELAAVTESMFRISCRFECPSPVLMSDPEAATHLYRIAQEAVHNAIKHGHAKQITLGLTREKGEVVLRIVDDGVGISDDVQAEGIGLRLMKRRANTMDAILKIGPNPRGGCVVDCRLPASHDT